MVTLKALLQSSQKILTYADEHADGVIGWFEFDAEVEDAQKLAKLTMASL